LHLPLNEQTFHYVNADFLQNFKHKISIINTSRGKIIDFQALIDAIEVGLVTKAMIDVFENEPFEEVETVKKYIQEKKLFLTPHIAGWSFESYFLLSKLVSEKIVNQLFNKLS
jgi:D-3-phosphoglycerate dehydrogenase